MSENIKHEFFIWEENNYTKQKKNNCKQEENDNCSTTTETKTDLTQNDWRNITDPNLKKKAWDKDYYEKNKEKAKEYSKVWREVNKDKLKIKKKAYYESNKDKIKAYQEANKDHIKLKKKVWREDNKDEIKIRQKNYNEANKERIKLKNKAYHQANKEKIKIQHNNYTINRLKTDIQFKLSYNLRNRLRSAINRNQKIGSAVRDLGCTIDELKIYLESKFLSGMSWDNWSVEGWHIDHIKPLSSFDLTDRQQLLEACHYTNLQPLWAKDNLVKNDKLI
jgi:hypothetical protein